ncbi:MAG: flagellar biosynthetic protein FliO [bacterium]|nr:flagellar biosynthetic protein FliO [bacterium]
MNPTLTGNELDYTWIFFKMIGVLGLLVVLMLVLAKFVIPLLTQRGILKKTAGNYISVIQRFVLEPHKNLYILKVAGKYLLVGVTEKGINLISEVSKDEIKD